MRPALPLSCAEPACYGRTVHTAYADTALFVALAVTVHELTVLG